MSKGKDEAGLSIWDAVSEARIVADPARFAIFEISGGDLEAKQYRVAAMRPRSVVWFAVSLEDHIHAAERHSLAEMFEGFAAAQEEAREGVEEEIRDALTEGGQELQRLLQRMGEKPGHDSMAHAMRQARTSLAGLVRMSVRSIDEICANCQHWNQFNDHDGACLRFPPNADGARPVTKDKNRCGEFNERMPF